MALSKEIKRFLESSKEPLYKRQKLAENAFLSNELQINQKEELILNTICTQIPKQPKFLQTLQRCVDSPIFSHELKLKPENKELIIDLISKEFQNDSKNTKKCLKILQAIFKNVMFINHFKNNLEKFAELLVNLLKFTKKYLGTSGELKIFSLDCCEIALEILEQFAKDSKKMISEIFVEKILFPLANIVDLEKPSDQITSETQKLIQLIFFSKSNIPSYRDAENSDEAVLFKIKGQIWTSSPENVFAVFTLISRTLIVGYKNDTEIIDLILRKFYEISGKQKLKIFNVLATYLIEVALDFDHKIKDLTLNQFLEKVVDKVVKSKKFSCTEYQVLTRISILNPIIIEEKNQDILNRISDEKNVSEEDKKWRGNFFEELFQVTTRLRLEQKFVSWILMSMKNKSLENVSEAEILDFAVLGEEVLEKFENHLGGLSSKHALNIFLTLLFHLKNDCVDVVEENFSAAVIWTLKTITKFTVAYLRGVRIFDHTISLDSKIKFVSSLMELKNLLNLLLEKMLASGSDTNSIAENLLNIAFHWTEVISLMKFYAPKSVDAEEVFPFSKEQLKKLKKSLEVFEDEKSQQLLEEMKNLKKKRDYFVEEKCPLPSSSLKTKTVAVTGEKFKKPRKNLQKLKNDDLFHELAVFLKEPKIYLSQEILAILSFLIHRKVEYTMGRLPPFIKVLSEIARIVIDESRNEETILEKRDFVVLMLEMNKIVIALIKLGKATKRLCPFLLADLIFWYSKGFVPFYVKEPLEATIAQLFSVCDQHSIAFLSRCLPKGTEEIFKSFYATFKKFHKFTGKI